MNKLRTIYNVYSFEECLAYTKLSTIIIQLKTLNNHGEISQTKSKTIFCFGFPRIRRRFVVTIHTLNAGYSQIFIYSTVVLLLRFLVL